MDHAQEVGFWRAIGGDIEGELVVSTRRSRSSKRSTASCGSSTSRGRERAFELTSRSSTA